MPAQKTSRPIPTWLDLNQRYTVEEAAALLRQSRAKTYADITSGALDSFKDGRRRYISGEAIAARSRGGRNE